MAGPVHVVVADDDAQVRAAMCDALAAGAGVHVVAAACDGPELLALVERLRPAIVVADVGMPGGGPGLVRRLRQQRPDLAVVSVSGTPDPGLARSVVAAGAEALVRKGIDDLVGTVARMAARLRAAG